MGRNTPSLHTILFLTVSLLLVYICFSFTISVAEENRSWEPSPPQPDEFDWVQLTSGEWLKGEIKGLHRKELDFDSEELKLRKFKWKDVKKLRSPRTYDIRLTGPLTTFGSFQIDEQKIKIYWGEQEQEFPRNQIISLAPFGDREVDLWSGKIGLGINFIRGNSSQEQYNASLNIKRRTSKTRFVVDYFGNIATTNGLKTVDNSRIQTQIDIFKTLKYYYRPLYGEYYLDPIKNIKYKATIGCGVGYYLINTYRTEWEIGTGLGYQETSFESVEQGQSRREDSMVFLGGSNFNIELTDDIDFIVNYSFQIFNKASGTYAHHTTTSFEIELTDTIDIDISFVWDRVQDPKRNDLGIIPDKNDYNLIFALGVEF